MPSATLDFTMSGTHSLVPHAPVARAPHTWPMRSDVHARPFAAAWARSCGRVSGSH